MKIRWMLLIFILIVAGCAHGLSEDMIKKAEIDSGNMTIDEQVIDLTIEDVIDIPLDDSFLTIPLDSVPILKQYLIGFDDLEKAVNHFNVERISNEVQNLYLIEFSCVNQRCSYLLLNNDDSDHSILIADLAKYESTILSPDKSRLLLLFSRPKSDVISTHNIIIVEVATFKQLHPINNTANIMMLNYTRPFSSITWLDDETIAITGPNVIEPEQIEVQVNLHEQETVTTILHVE